MYELWDLRGGNMIDAFRTEAEALAWVRQSVLDEGPVYAGELALLALDADSQRVLTAQGVALVELARTQTPAA